MTNFSDGLWTIFLIVGIIYALFGLKISKLTLGLTVVLTSVSIGLFIALGPQLSSLVLEPWYLQGDILAMGSLAIRLLIGFFVGLIVGLVLALRHFKFSIYILQILINVLAFFVTYLVGNYLGTEVMGIIFILFFIPLSILTVTLVFFNKYYVLLYSFIVGLISLTLGLLEISLGISYGNMPLALIFSLLASVLIMVIGLSLQRKIWPRSMFLSKDDYYKDQIDLINSQSYQEDIDFNRPRTKDHNRIIKNDYKGPKETYDFNEEEDLDLEDTLSAYKKKDIEEEVEKTKQEEDIDHEDYIKYNPDRTYEREINQKVKDYLVEDVNKFLNNFYLDPEVKGEKIEKSSNIISSNPIFKVFYKYINYIGLLYGLLLLINLFRKSLTINMFSQSLGLAILIMMVVRGNHKSGLALNIWLILYNILLIIMRFSTIEIFDLIFRIILILVLVYFLYIFIELSKNKEKVL